MLNYPKTVFYVTKERTVLPWPEVSYCVYSMKSNLFGFENIFMSCFFIMKNSCFIGWPPKLIQLL